jgi:hypothetical protein
VQAARHKHAASLGGQRIERGLQLAQLVARARCADRSYWLCTVSNSMIVSKSTACWRLALSISRLRAMVNR